MSLDVKVDTDRVTVRALLIARGDMGWDARPHRLPSMTAIWRE